jgi:hypothetical protein
MGGLPICPACTREDERIFEEVSAYIRDHQGVALCVVADELGISYEKLMKYVKEGRLQIRTNDGGFVMFCEKCGGMISKGKFCPKCENHITNVLEISQNSLKNKLTEMNKSDYRYFSGEAKKSRA